MELGQFIRQARKAKRITALKLIELADLKTTPATISIWETGKRSPTPDEIERICTVLNLDTKLALNLWARDQMPNKSLKALFSSGDIALGKRKPFEPKTSLSYPADKTITLQSRDAKWFTKNPAAVTILVRCLMAGLAKEFWNYKRLTSGINLPAKQLQLIIKTLFAMKYIVKSKSGYATEQGVEWVHLPETTEFLEVRKSRIRFALDHVLKNFTDPIPSNNVDSFARLYQNRLSKEQAKHVLDALRAVCSEITAMDTPQNEQTDAYYLVLGLGKEHEE